MSWVGLLRKAAPKKENASEELSTFCTSVPYDKSVLMLGAV
jgi:hypothetical protein